MIQILFFIQLSTAISRKTYLGSLRFFKKQTYEN